MSGKGTSLVDQAALTALTWTVLKSFYDRKHIRGTAKLGDFENSKYATKKGPKKEAIMANLTQEARNIIQDKIKERTRKDPSENKESKAQNIAGSLISDDSFLQSIRNIFTPTFTGTTPQPSDVEEEQPQPEDEEEDTPTPTPIKKITTKKKRAVPKLIQPEDEDEDSEDELTAGFVSNFFNRIKNEIKTAEGKKIIQQNLDNIQDIKLDGNLGEAYILNALRNIQNTDDEITDAVVNQYNVYVNKFRRKTRNIEKDDLLKKLSPTKKISTKQAEEEMPKEQISVPLMEQLKQNVSAPSMSNGTGLGMTMEQLKAARSKSGKPVRKVPKIKPSEASERAKLEEAVSSVLKQEQISTKKNVTTGFEEMGQRLDDINVILSSRPELKQIHADVVQQLQRAGYDAKRSDMKLQGLGIDKKIVEELIKTIPENNRAILAPAVRSIAGGGGVNMNNVVAGLVGLGVSLAGSPAIGTAITPLISGMMNTYGVDLNYYFLDQVADGVDGEIIDETDEEEQPQPGKGKEKEKEQKHSKNMTGILSDEEELKINEDVYDVISGMVEEAQPEASPAIKRNYIIDSLLSLPETVKRSISTRHREHPLEPPSEILRNVSADLELEEQPPQPRYDMPPPVDGLRIAQPVAPPPPYPMPPPQPAPVRRTNPFAGSGGAFVGGAGVGAVYGGMSAGVSTGSAQGAISGILPGAIAGGIAGLTSEQLLRRYYRRQGIQITPALNRQIRALSALPTAAVAAYLGYTPSGRAEDVAGTGTISGAGITEKKISVVPEVLEKTQAQLEQEKGKVKVWEPKAIVPSTAILDESKQEKYIDDVEFIAFNYIPPTSEGAQGTVDTNPLKYQQLLENNIRYTNAGVYIPYITWNKMYNTGNMRDMALGAKLPPMKFNTFDNEDTFENVAKWQYVNNENTAIEFQSPYADFSNVENSWWSNEENILFTENP